MLETTGLEGATLIPAGATLTRTYWNTPTLASPGATFDTQEEALVHGISEMQARLGKHASWYPDEQTRVALPECVTVDLRWVFQLPAGGTTDITAQRYTHDSIASAEAHVDRIRQYSADRAAA